MSSRKPSISLPRLLTAYATVEDGKITRLVTVFDRLPFGR
jgi:hypothetical protein